MSLLQGPLVILALLIAFVSTTNALPTITPVELARRAESISHSILRRDDQGLTNGWSDLSGSAKAGVILAPTLAVVFVMVAAFFIMQEKPGKKKMSWRTMFGRSKKRRAPMVHKPETTAYQNIPTITTAPPA